MNDAQAHRGPDGEGYAIAESHMTRHNRDAARLQYPSRCGLAHRRLAILDPAGGAQPMFDEDHSVAVLLNGEIYNFRSIRQRLASKGIHFRTDSDTEVLIHLYRENPEAPSRWLKEINGIYAIALWDQKRQRLLLARDVFGVKPLHYWQDENRFLFASEIKALLAAGVKARLHREALHVFLNIRYVPGKHTLFEGVKRLPPAHFAVVEDGRLVRCEQFYVLPDASTRTQRSRADVCYEVRSMFSNAVRRQLLSDVPVGLGLSGGLDSSMIVAAASEACSEEAGLRLADRVVRTFTLGFNEPTDENADAAAVAQHFGTEHHDARLSSEPLKVAQDVIRAVEEPKVNMLQGYELARFVKPHVKVLFSGLGGDELFAGYDIHRYCNTLGRANRAVPRWMQRSMLRGLSSAIWHSQHTLGTLRHEHYRIGAQIVLSVGDRAQFYTRLRNAWDEDRAMYGRLYAHPEMFLDCPRTASYFEDYFADEGNYLDQVMRAEFQTKLVDDFLVNEDRVTSAHGVEGRVPFLDKDLVECAFRIPSRWKMSGTGTKQLWKESVGNQLPRQILDKKKQGFTFSSYHQWEKDLRIAVNDNLTREWCEDVGLFNHEFVNELANYPPHPNLRWHYFVAWMMLGVKDWIDVFNVEV